MRRNETCCPMGIKFCRVVAIPDIITKANFGDSRLRDLGVAGVKFCRSHGLSSSSLGTLALPCDCAIDYRLIKRDVAITAWDWYFTSTITQIKFIILCRLISLYDYHRQHCEQLKAPVLKLLRGRFWVFFAPQGRQWHVAPMVVKFGTEPPCQVSPHRCNDNCIGPPQLNFCW